MTKLLIVESPAKAKTISKYLGSDYVVRASVGHVRDLPKSNKKAIDIENNFLPNYEISRGKEKVVAELSKLAKKADEVLLAMDPDREGEAIAWHISELLVGVPKKNIKRVSYHEITKEAITEALKHPRAIDENLRKAQEARRVLDRLVGYDLSGLIWKKVRYGLSAGRVQSPALRILVEREREINAFDPETFWTITAQLKTEKEEVPFVCVEEPRDYELVKTILDKGNSGTWKVADIVETEAKRSPRPPFITSTLQQAASTRLGFSPSRTMRAAQKLYEAGHITYMRTDSTTISKQALGQIAGIIEKDFGKENLQFRTFAKKSKNAQEAHEAIRPTNAQKKVVSGSGDESALYELIWRRTVASQMKDALSMRTKILAEIQNENLPLFAVNGARIMNPGWLMVDPKARGEDIEVPKVVKGDLLSLISLTEEEKQTQPPSRYSEAGLIKELEKRGIGRPSTYASTIRTIEERGYVDKEGRTLKPTDTGEVVSTFLEDNFGMYISDTFTAQMEDTLDNIAEGKIDYADTLKAFYGPFQKDVASKEGIDKITTLGDAPKEFPCPDCNAPMVIKLGKNGKFLSCSKYPDCKGARKIDGSILAGDTPIGVHPESGEPIFVLDGRFGPYVQMGEKTEDNPKPKRASIPKEKDPHAVTIEEATHYLALPRTLGSHPESGKDIFANIGRFGPYVGCDGEFRSLKAPDDPYTVSFDRALALLNEPKRLPKGVELVRDLGRDPKGKKSYQILKSKSGLFVKHGRRRIYLPPDMNPEKATIDDIKNIIAVS
ncbi:MAG: type I DNA topoisomerase [Candidatus Paceibacterota bacterium]